MGESLKHSNVKAAKDSLSGREVHPPGGFPLKTILKALTQRSTHVKSKFQLTEA